ncbi:MAG: hypothetical protein K6F05_04495 [Succinivibrio sp.]|nr:hypothetical protein [Succinivibrio sp.]
MTKSIFLLLATVLSASLLLGCDDKNAPSVENFTNAINAVLVSSKAVIPAPGVPSHTQEQTTYIEDVTALENMDNNYTRSDKNKFRRQITYAKLLQSTGMAMLKKGTFRDTSSRGEIKQYYGYIVTFNDKYAKDVVKYRDGKIGLVAGFVGVEKILKYTEPKDIKGKTTSYVTYTRTVINRPEWATDTVLDYAGVKNHLNGKQTAKLVLSETGWKVDGYRGHGLKMTRGGKGGGQDVDED